jgi:hypothetical protein
MGRIVDGLCGKRTGIYRESGWVARVEILEDNSDEKWTRYKLKVIDTIREPTMFKTPGSGMEFEVERNKEYSSYLCWSLDELR